MLCQGRYHEFQMKHRDATYNLISFEKTENMLLTTVM